MTLYLVEFRPPIPNLRLYGPGAVEPPVSHRYTYPRIPTGPLPKGTPSLGGFFFAPGGIGSPARGIR